MPSEGAGPGEIAEALAELKAMRISPRHPGLIVLGADQILECEGSASTSPRGSTGARAQLQALSRPAPSA